LDFLSIFEKNEIIYITNTLRDISLRCIHIHIE